MIRIVNRTTGKEALTIQDNGDQTVDGKLVVSEKTIEQAFKEAMDEETKEKEA